MQTIEQYSPGRRKLVRLMQRVNHGRIEGLHVRGGEPVFEPQPLVTEQRLLDRGGEPRRENMLQDFTPKREIVELFRQLANVRPGATASIAVQAGLPVKLEISGPLMP